MRRLERNIMLKKSGKVSKTQVFAIVFAVIGYVLYQLTDMGVIDGKWSGLVMSTYAFINIQLRSITTEPLMSSAEKRINKEMKNVFKNNSSLVLIVLLMSSCTTASLKCKNLSDKVYVDLYQKKVVVACEGGSPSVTVETVGGAIIDGGSTTPVGP